MARRCCCFSRTVYCHCSRLASGGRHTSSSRQFPAAWRMGHAMALGGCPSTSSGHSARSHRLRVSPARLTAGQDHAHRAAQGHKKYNNDSPCAAQIRHLQVDLVCRSVPSCRSRTHRRRGASSPQHFVTQHTADAWTGQLLARTRRSRARAVSHDATERSQLSHSHTCSRHHLRPLRGGWNAVCRASSPSLSLPPLPACRRARSLLPAPSSTELTTGWTTRVALRRPRTPPFARCTRAMPVRCTR